MSIVTNRITRGHRFVRSRCPCRGRLPARDTLCTRDRRPRGRIQKTLAPDAGRRFHRCKSASYFYIHIASLPLSSGTGPSFIQIALPPAFRYPSASFSPPVLSPPLLAELTRDRLNRSALDRLPLRKGDGFEIRPLSVGYILVPKAGFEPARVVPPTPSRSRCSTKFRPLRHDFFFRFIPGYIAPGALPSQSRKNTGSGVFCQPENRFRRASGYFSRPVRSPAAAGACVPWGTGGAGTGGGGPSPPPAGRPITTEVAPWKTM